jgi:hypothetical protein
MGYSEPANGQKVYSYETLHNDLMISEKTFVGMISLVFSNDPPGILRVKT